MPLTMLRVDQFRPLHQTGVKPDYVFTIEPDGRSDTSAVGASGLWPTVPWTSARACTTPGAPRQTSQSATAVSLHRPTPSDHKQFC